MGVIDYVIRLPVGKHSSCNPTNLIFLLAVTVENPCSYSESSLPPSNVAAAIMDSAAPPRSDIM